MEFCQLELKKCQSDVEERKSDILSGNGAGSEIQICRGKTRLISALKKRILRLEMAQSDDGMSLNGDFEGKTVKSSELDVLTKDYSGAKVIRKTPCKREPNIFLYET